MTSASDFGGPPAAPGTVHLVGGGPGDPGLVGLRAARLLASATFVAYDRLAPAELLAVCADDAERVYVGKLPDRHALAQEEINALLVAKASAGHAVVRWKGGDPFVLARGSEEAAACVAAEVPFEVVPAVTSGIAAPAYAGIPVTHRGLAPAFAVATGHEDPTKDAADVDYDALARFPGTLLLYMGMGRLRAIAEALVDGGRPATEPVALVRWGTTPRQETLTGTLAGIADRAEAVDFANPAIIVVGPVVGLRDQLAWFDRRPLHGVSVLVPRTRHQASTLVEGLRALGADPVTAPTIRLAAPEDPAALSVALDRLPPGGAAQRPWLVLTSANVVDAVWDALVGSGRDARRLAGCRLAAVGQATADALAAHGLAADLVPERQTAPGLADALLAHSPGPASALIPHADIAAPTLVERLTGAGWEVDDVEAYRTVPADALPPNVVDRITSGEVDVIAFSSSSTARNLVALLGALPSEGVRIASIGPSTTATCRELGLRVDAEASPHDVGGLLEAIRAAHAP